MAVLAERITDLIAPSLEAMGIAVVQVNIVDGSKRKTVQVLAENRETGRITLDECALASRTISALLDVEDAVVGAYNLEVSSPGIDRPLISLADFARYIGFEARIEVALPVEGRSRFRGELLSAADGTVVLRVDNQEYALAMDNIRKAKLVLTDALIKAHAKKSETTE